MTKQQAVDFLKNKPYLFGHMLGFDKLSEIHNDWIKNMVFGRGDISLAASRQTYKTTCDSIALALIIILLPNKRTLFMRKTDSDVKEIIAQVSKILKDQHTEFFVNAIYGVKIKILSESAMHISTNLMTDMRGTAQLLGIGTNSSLTGKHFDRIFTDDIINLKDRISQAERERTKLIYQELQNIKNRDGRIINTLTIWHKQDASLLMPNLVKYDCYHPEIKKIITAEQLQDIKSKMTPALFACNYELKIIADEDLLFGERPTGASIENIFGADCHIDSAFGGEDYTAFTAMSYRDGCFYVYGKCWRKHIENCYNDIYTDYVKYQLGKCRTETNADKGFVARDLKRKFGMRMATYHEGMNKHIKISTFLKAIWDKVIFVKGTDDEYIEQILDYSAEAEHDDCADSAASLARKLYKKAGIRVDVQDNTKESED